MERTDNADLTIFLVEEPEAHLHPQLQAAVLSFLQERSECSLAPKEDKDAPAGHLQVIVATHSPNLAAWVPSKRLVYVRSNILDMSLTQPPNAPSDQGNAKAEDTSAPTADEQCISRPESRCVPLAKLSLDGEDRRKLDRYLDVTKSALLFGGRVLLVEGIAEALLIPVIAKHHVLHNRPHALRRFRSAVFVPIDGVDFAPYVRALLVPHNGVRIADRLVVLTDGDRHAVGPGDELPGETRKVALNAIAASNGATEILDVFTNTYSFEAELVVAGNQLPMKEAYLAIHPRSEEKWDRAIFACGEERFRIIQELFATTPKGDYAQVLADRIADEHAFLAPEYIRDAIEALVK